MRHRNHRTVKGFSLVELLIGIALSCLVVLVLYEVMTSQNRIYSLQDDMSEMQQSLRVGIERIARDLTMAGFGKPSRLGTTSWPTLNNGVTGLDFSIRVTGANTLDIVGCLDPADGQLAAAVSTGATSITVGSGQGVNFNSTTKCDISIGGKENAKVTGVSGDTLTIDTNPLLSGNQGFVYGFPANTSVFVVKYHTYTVDTSDAARPVLKVDAHLGAGSQEIAQFVNGLSMSLSGNALNLTLTGRTRKQDRTTGQYVTAQLADKVYLRNLPNTPE